MRALSGAWEGIQEALAGAERVAELLDETPDVVNFAETLERVCVETVESGSMTKDLAILVGPEQEWLTTNQFLDKLDQNLQAAMG